MLLHWFTRTVRCVSYNGHYCVLPNKDSQQTWAACSSAGSMTSTAGSMEESWCAACCLCCCAPGVDKEHNQLVVAIIDFIRTYTWDKQLETWVKSSGILGGAGG